MNPRHRSHLKTSSPRRPSAQDHRNQTSPLHNLTLLQPAIKLLVSSGQRRIMAFSFVSFLQKTIFLFNTVTLLWHNLFCKKHYINTVTGVYLTQFSWTVVIYFFCLHFKDVVVNSSNISKCLFANIFKFIKKKMFKINFAVVLLM